MITVKELKNRLEKCLDSDMVYAYEGEDIGIAVCRTDVNGKSFEVDFIHASEKVLDEKDIV